MYLDVVHPNATPDQKVTFIMSHLDSIACDWLKPFMEQDILQGEIIPFLHDDQQFWAEFRARYGIVNHDEYNQAKLCNLNQKGSVQDYLSQFETLTATLHYNDAALRGMFYNRLSEEVVNDNVIQDFDPSGTTTLHQLVKCALNINKQHHPITKKTVSITSSACNNNVSFASNTSNTTHEQLKKGHKVYMIRTDGHAKKGTIAEISKNSCGKNVLNVKWNRESNLLQVPFRALKIDTCLNLSTLQLAKGSGPGPMELDGANKGKAVLSCHVCGARATLLESAPGGTSLGTRPVLMK